MTAATNDTHRARAVPPTQFRAQATGCGNTRSASEATGAARAQQVIDAAPEAARRAIAPAEGYPARG